MSAPFIAKACQFSGSIPRGHGSASFEVPVANAYLGPHHVLKEGAWIEIYDDAHELYEGEIFSVKPSADGAGNHKLSVVCGGLISVAAKRADVSATWVHRGSEGWARRMGTPSNLANVDLDNGKIELRVSAGTTQSVVSNTINTSLAAYFYLDNGLSDATISHVDLAGAYDVDLEGAYTWQWHLYTAAKPEVSWVESALVITNSASASWSDHLTPPAGTKALLLLMNSSAIHATTVEKFVTMTTMDIFSMDTIGKVRLDEAMVQIAKKPGLAISHRSQSVGPLQDDLSIGSGTQKTTVAAGLDTLAARYAQPFEWYFTDAREFVVNPMPLNPVNDAQVIVVSKNDPALESWDVAIYDEDVPVVACVLFGNLTDTTLPEGYPRRMFRPYDPGDDYAVRVVTIDYTNTILSDSSAAALGDNLVAESSDDIPSGFTFDANPALASSGTNVGNNTDPTTLYRDAYSVLVDGTLMNYDYTPTSGWAGSNSPSDPFCLVGNGASDYVDFGNLAAFNFGTGPFSIRVWVKALARPTVSNIVQIASKMASGQGWYLGMDSSGYLIGYVATSDASYRKRVGGTVLALGAWYHVIMTYAGSGLEVALYVNGIEQTYTSTGATGAWNTTNAGPLRLMRGP